MQEKTKESAVRLISQLNKLAYLYVRATFTEKDQEKAKEKLDKQIAKVFSAISGRSPTPSEINRCRGW